MLLQPAGKETLNKLYVCVFGIAVNRMLIFAFWGNHVPKQVCFNLFLYICTYVWCFADIQCFAMWQHRCHNNIMIVMHFVMSHPKSLVVVPMPYWSVVGGDYSCGCIQRHPSVSAWIWFSDWNFTNKHSAVGWHFFLALLVLTWPISLLFVHTHGIDSYFCEYLMVHLVQCYVR